MKRIFALLFAYLMLLVLSACTKEQPVIVSQTDQFTIRRNNGVCYLDLGSDNTRASWGGGCLVPSGYASFRSADEMYRTLMSGAFDETDIWDIRCTFPLDEELGFQIMDPEKIFVPVLPTDCEVGRVLMGSSELVYYTDCGRFSVISQESYESGLRKLSRFILKKDSFEDLTKYEDGDRDVYEYWDWELLHRVTQYSIETDEKTFYVEYEYIEPDDDPDVHKYGEDEVSVYILGCHNGVCFKMECGGLDEPLSEEWIMQLGAEAYIAEGTKATN